MIRAYMFDIGKIVEGAKDGDFDKVTAYTQSLANRLEAGGEKAAAKRIRSILSNDKAGMVWLASDDWIADDLGGADEVKDPPVEGKLGTLQE